MTNMPIVVLKDITRRFGPARSGLGFTRRMRLRSRSRKVTTPRPMTHDLIKVLLMGLETSVRKVVVSELKG